ncbi:preprotein translocase subunit YajC [Bifidobacterium callimiconis]|uniref:Preprotein translocase n=1 Tax=Bifidobacterium callimiconis TaxID=2306973 RepID=A0A430FHZ2_9BIFI|nr:preprotein translocase subunit YajC [Bifidobacterium callimiconis]MBT1177944.1 preprotein translocase subunit YajC [Bifidobacterium callimiconis]RSX52318.1 preprotein translocase [Bifidobacterium callimiconis]
MGGNSNTMMLIAIIVVFAGMMWYQSRQSKKKQGQVQDFRTNLKKGDPVATFSGLIGVVEEVDLDADQIVINSEGTLSRWRIQAITEPPVVPNYVSDEEYEREQKAKNEEADQAEAADTKDEPNESADYVNPSDAHENTETVTSEESDKDTEGKKDEPAK